MPSKRPGWDVWRSAFELTGRREPYLHLERANSRGVCHCTCRRALVATPDQLACPWCGCGWLFCCMMCGRAFTYAKPVLIDASLAELVERDLLTRGWHQEPELIESSANYLSGMLAEVEEGREYVYLDGCALGLDARDIEFDGIHARHTLATLPHADELTNPGAMDTILGDAAYWQDRELPPCEEEPEQS